MSADFDTLRASWAAATANLEWGQQRAFVDVLTLVAEGKSSDLVWGQDYGDGGACLVNKAANMLTTGGGSGVPSAHFGEVVSLYDRINRAFGERDINTDRHVSPLAADILLQWFAPLKEAPTERIANQFITANDEPYVEPTDESMVQALKEMLSTEAPSVEPTPFDVPSNENV